MLSERESPGKWSAKREQAEHLLRRFHGRDDVIAVSNGKGFQPEYLKSPLTPERIVEEHLGGKQCIAFYPMLLGNVIRCSCLDFDNKPARPDREWWKKSTAVARLLRKHGITALVELSQSGSAAHVWLFFKKPIAAAIVRAFLRGILKILAIAEPEIYPRQDELKGKKLGNAIRYPLWNLSCFVDLTSARRPLHPVEAMSSASLVSLGDLKRVAGELDFTLSPEKPRSIAFGLPEAGQELPARVRQLLEQNKEIAARWRGESDGLSDRSRSSVVMSLACMLVRHYVPTTEIEATIGLWCSAREYEKGLRDDWVEGVINAAYDFVGKCHQNKGQRSSPGLPAGTPEAIRNEFRRTVKCLAAKTIDTRGGRTSR